MLGLIGKWRRWGSIAWLHKINFRATKKIEGDQRRKWKPRNQILGVFDNPHLITFNIQLALVWSSQKLDEFRPALSILFVDWNEWGPKVWLKYFLGTSEVGRGMAIQWKIVTKTEWLKSYLSNENTVTKKKAIQNTSKAEVFPPRNSWNQRRKKTETTGVEKSKEMNLPLWQNKTEGKPTK